MTLREFVLLSQECKYLLGDCGSVTGRQILIGSL